MQGKFMKACLVATVMLLAGVLIANAFASSASGFTDGTSFISTAVRANASGSQGTCTLQVQTGFYQWDLTSISDSTTIQQATITMTTAATGNTVPVASTLSIYAASSDTLSATTTPVGLPLASIQNIVDTVPATLTFLTTTDLAAYVQSQLVDNKATFVLRWSQCAVGGTDAVVAVRLLTSADLTLGTNAVTMSTFRAVNPAVNWPLIIGLVALVAVVIGGAAVTRKRAAGR